MKPMSTSRPLTIAPAVLAVVIGGCVLRGSSPSSDDDQTAETTEVAGSDDDDGASSSSTTSDEDIATGTETSNGATDASAGGSSGTDTTGTGEPACVDGHFVVFLADDGVMHADVPAGVMAVRTFADATQQEAVCHPGGPGECLLACIPAEIQVETITIQWTCSSGQGFASHTEDASVFLIEIPLSADEASAGCNG